MLQAGVVSSSNNLGYSDQDMKQMLENDTAVKEMEGAAIAWSAHHFETPALALKSITDIVDGDRPPQEEFLENLQRAALALKVSSTARLPSARHAMSKPQQAALHTLSSEFSLSKILC